MKPHIENFGALGNWRRIDERVDETVVKQLNDASCVAAVGEMLARLYGLKTSQPEIWESIGNWSNSAALAACLNAVETRKDVEWIGGGFPDEPLYIEGISKSVRAWAGLLRDGEALGHAVLLVGQDDNGLIIVQDPFDQTSYKMEITELHRVLSEFVLRRSRRDD